MWSCRFIQLKELGRLFLEAKLFIPTPHFVDQKTGLLCPSRSAPWPNTSRQPPRPTQPVSSWTFWPFYQVKPSYMFWLFFCSTFWSTSRVKLTTSICFKTMQVLPVRKAPLPDRQGHLSTCSLYVLELKWICRFLSWKSHALTSNCCWRYLYDRTSCQSLITMIVVITMFHHQWNEWMNE